MASIISQSIPHITEDQSPQVVPDGPLQPTSKSELPPKLPPPTTQQSKTTSQQDKDLDTPTPTDVGHFITHTLFCIASSSMISLYGLCILDDSHIKLTI